MQFTKFLPTGQYSYINEIEFDNNIKTDSDSKALCRNAANQSKKKLKRELPYYYFFSNIEGTLLTSVTNKLPLLITGLLLTPNDVLDYGNITFTGLACIDIANLSGPEIQIIKSYCHKDNNIKYCASSASGKGCFILYDVGIENQINQNIIKDLNNDFYGRVYSLLHKRDFIVDQITSSAFCCRFESYDPEPYNNFGDTDE